MSTRAIRAMRHQLNSLTPAADCSENENSDDDDEDSDDRYMPTKRSTFALIDDSEEEEGEEDSSCNPNTITSEDSFDNENIIVDCRSSCQSDDETQRGSATVTVEDLDAMLNEFTSQDRQFLTKDKSDSTIETKENNVLSSCMRILLKDFKSRDLDYDFSLRNCLATSGLVQKDNDGKMKGRKLYTAKRNAVRSNTHLFGVPRNGWVRPPNFVGGGMGMTSLSQNESIPWPYADLSCSNWVSFLYSDTYERDCHDYFSIIQQSGDFSALIMFVAHHPFCSPALLQLSTVMYQTNHHLEGLSLLLRTLYVYEQSMSFNFKQYLLQSISSFSSSNENGIDINSNAFVNGIFLNHEKIENNLFFSALKKLVQVSNIAG